MHQSDSDSSDSDKGVRYKTSNTRNKTVSSYSDLSRARSRSPKRYKDADKCRKRTRDRPSAQKNEDYRKVKRPSSKAVDKQTPSQIGPKLPPHLSVKTKNVDEKILATEEIAETDVGPSLPPNLQNKSTASKIIGPQLPSQLVSDDSINENEIQEINEEEKDSDVGSYGPQLPQHLQKNIQKVSSDSDEDYGPLPLGTTSKIQEALEERALELKINQLNPPEADVVTREEWMLELPEVKAANLGLGPRQFRSKGVPDMSKRSAWTDTPSKKSKNPEEIVDLKKESEVMSIQKRDQEQEEMAKKYKKKKKGSLLEMHQEKVKKTAKGDGPTERKPFSRETDLQVNRFDEAQKKAVLKKAQLLNDRFSSGQSKFL